MTDCVSRRPVCTYGKLCRVAPYPMIAALIDRVEKRVNGVAASAAAVEMLGLPEMWDASPSSHDQPLPSLDLEEYLHTDDRGAFLDLVNTRGPNQVVTIRLMVDPNYKGAVLDTNGAAYLEAEVTAFVISEVQVMFMLQPVVESAPACELPARHGTSQARAPKTLSSVEDDGGLLSPRDPNEAYVVLDGTTSFAMEISPAMAQYGVGMDTSRVGTGYLLFDCGLTVRDVRRDGSVGTGFRVWLFLC